MAVAGNLRKCVQAGPEAPTDNLPASHVSILVRGLIPEMMSPSGPCAHLVRRGSAASAGELHLLQYFNTAMLHRGRAESAATDLRPHDPLPG